MEQGITGSELVLYGIDTGQSGVFSGETIGIGLEDPR